MCFLKFICLLVARFVVVGSKDMTAKIYSIEDVPGFSSVTLSGHRHSLVACFFQSQSLHVRLLTCIVCSVECTDK